jgi:uncharacterized protein involved in outer membrane biogenesis
MKFRPVKIVAWSLLGLIAVVVLLVILVLLFDWNYAKPWINKQVSQATGRTFAIKGDLSVKWSLNDRQEAGWRAWVPTPRVSAEDISFANVDWAKNQEMAEVKKLVFSVSPLPLLEKKFILPGVEIERPHLSIDRAGDGKNNWTFKLDSAGDEPSEWRLELQRLVVNNGLIQVLDAIRKVDMKADINTEVDSQYGISWKFAGSYNGETVSGSGRAGTLVALQQQNPYPVEAHAQLGKTVIDVQGVLNRPSDLAGLDVHLKISGVSMAALFPITGIVLPETPPYSTEGRLVGTLNSQGGNWLYEKFSGKVGSSDLAGTLEYSMRQPRPLLRGEVISHSLSMIDLAPLIGADSNESKARRGVPALQPPGKVLPVEEFKAERWDSIDADVRFTGRKIVRDKALPIENLTAHVRLQNGILSLTPLKFGIAGGSLVSYLKLDGTSKPLKAELKITARGLRLKNLLPTFELTQASFGEIRGAASLSATGNSVAALLGSSNGEIKASLKEGTISKLLVEAMGLNVGSIIVTKIKGDEQIKLNCVAGEFAVTNGQMQAQTVKVDTEDSVVDVGGQISLSQEKFDLTIKSESKGMRVISLSSPIYIKGTFLNPDVALDKGILALKAGGAGLLGAVAPAATAVLPLVNVGTDQDTVCATLLKAVNRKPVAPPPGRKYQRKGARVQPATPAARATDSGKK